MRNRFICPNCKGYLNVGGHVVLSAFSLEKKRGGLIFLNQEIGNYSFETNPDFKTSEGEKFEFYCPVCHEKLAADAHDHLSRIIMVDKDNNEYEVLFSKIAGERSTYKIIGEQVETYGEHSSIYIDFINLSLIK